VTRSTSPVPARLAIMVIVNSRVPTFNRFVACHPPRRGAAALRANGSADFRRAGIEHAQMR
jgi:hypothetical protein